MNESFLQKLLDSISVSGYEEPVQKTVEAELSGYAQEIRRDEMGNLVCVRNKEDKTRILLSAHADEIGLIVSDIAADGRLSVIRRGGIIPSTWPGRQVRIQTGKGVIYGAVEVTRSLFQKKDLSAKDIRIDIGVDSKEEAEALVEIGDPIVPDTQIRKMAGTRFSARALDDRIGVYIISEAFKRAAEAGCKNGVYSASTIGEEVTKSGAYWVSARVKPTMAIVVDVTYTSDYPGMDPAETGNVRLGGGAVLCKSPIVPKELNQKMLSIAKEKGIPVQWEVAESHSCTDADKIHFSNEGVPTVLVSVPLRYMHTPAEVADERDVEACIALISAFLLSYKEEAHL